MRIIVWALWLLLFLLFFGFAINNTEPTTLHFFSGWTWQAPLIALLVVFFFGGVVFGFLAMLPTWFRLRLQIRRMKKAQVNQSRTVADTVTRTTAQAEAIQNVAQGARTTT